MKTRSSHKEIIFGKSRCSVHLEKIVRPRKNKGMIFQNCRESGNVSGEKKASEAIGENGVGNNGFNPNKTKLLKPRQVERVIHPRNLHKVNLSINETGNNVLQQLVQIVKLVYIRTIKPFITLPPNFSLKRTGPLKNL